MSDKKCITHGCEEVEVEEEYYCKSCLYCSECGGEKEEHTWEEMSCEKCDFVTCDYCGNKWLYIYEHDDSQMARVSLNGSGFSSDDYLIPNGMDEVCRYRCYDEVTDYYDGEGKCRICGEHHPITQDNNCELKQEMKKNE
tara:strand:- start:27645 stop:28064 length:420 start_codon:yes stop_codon:yes gene_type:complete